jgi:hypothetical protein
MEHFRAAQLPALVRPAEEHYILGGTPHFYHTFTPGVDRAEFRAELNRPTSHRKYSARFGEIIYDRICP